MGLRGEYIFNIAVVTAKGLVMSQGSGASAASAERVFKALDGFRIEVHRGACNTGTRFRQVSRRARRRRWRKSSAMRGEVNKLTGASPTVALHVLWDLPNGKGDVAELLRLEKKYGVKPGSINPNCFKSQGV